MNSASYDVWLPWQPSRTMVWARRYVTYMHYIQPKPTIASRSRPHVPTVECVPGLEYLPYSVAVAKFKFQGGIGKIDFSIPQSETFSMKSLWEATSESVTWATIP